MSYLLVSSMRTAVFLFLPWLLLLPLCFAEEYRSGESYCVPGKYFLPDAELANTNLNKICTSQRKPQGIAINWKRPSVDGLGQYVQNVANLCFNQYKSDNKISHQTVDCTFTTIYNTIYSNCPNLAKETKKSLISACTIYSGFTAFNNCDDFVPKCMKNFLAAANTPAPLPTRPTYEVSFSRCGTSQKGLSDANRNCVLPEIDALLPATPLGFVKHVRANCEKGDKSQQDKEECIFSTIFNTCHHKTVDSVKVLLKMACTELKSSVEHCSKFSNECFDKFLKISQNVKIDVDKSMCETKDNEISVQTGDCDKPVDTIFKNCKGDVKTKGKCLFSTIFKKCYSNGETTKQLIEKTCKELASNTKDCGEFSNQCFHNFIRQTIKLDESVCVKDKEISIPSEDCKTIDVDSIFGKCKGDDVAKGKCLFTTISKCANPQAAMKSACTQLNSDVDCDEFSQKCFYKFNPIKLKDSLCDTEHKGIQENPKCPTTDKEIPGFVNEILGKCTASSKDHSNECLFTTIFKQCADREISKKVMQSACVKRAIGSPSEHCVSFTDKCLAKFKSKIITTTTSTTVTTSTIPTTTAPPTTTTQATTTNPPTTTMTTVTTTPVTTTTPTTTTATTTPKPTTTPPTPPKTSPSTTSPSTTRESPSTTVTTAPVSGSTAATEAPLPPGRFDRVSENSDPVISTAHDPDEERRLQASQQKAEGKASKEEEGGSGLTGLWVFLGLFPVFAAAGGGVAFYFVRRRLKKKREAAKATTTSTSSSGAGLKKKGAPPPPRKGKKAKDPKVLHQMPAGKLDGFIREGPLVVDVALHKGQKMTHATGDDEGQLIEAVVFDETMNVIVDMGSDIEKVVTDEAEEDDGGKGGPKKEKQSLQKSVVKSGTGA